MDWFKTMENVLACLAPQAVKLVRLLPPSPETEVVNKAYAGVTVLSEMAIVLLHVHRLPLGADERARLGMSAPQVHAALAPAAE